MARIQHPWVLRARWALWDHARLDLADLTRADLSGGSAHRTSWQGATLSGLNDGDLRRTDPVRARGEDFQVS